MQLELTSVLSPVSFSQEYQLLLPTELQELFGRKSNQTYKPVFLCSLCFCMSCFSYSNIIFVFY